MVAAACVNGKQIGFREEDLLGLVLNRVFRGEADIIGKRLERGASDQVMDLLQRVGLFLFHFFSLCFRSLFLFFFSGFLPAPVRQVVALLLRLLPHGFRLRRFRSRGLDFGLRLCRRIRLLLRRDRFLFRFAFGLVLLRCPHRVQLGKDIVCRGLLFRQSAILSENGKHAVFIDRDGKHVTVIRLGSNFLQRRTDLCGNLRRGASAVPGNFKAADVPRFELGFLTPFFFQDPDGLVNRACSVRVCLENPVAFDRKFDKHVNS